MLVVIIIMYLLAASHMILVLVQDIRATLVSAVVVSGNSTSPFNVQFSKITAAQEFIQAINVNELSLIAPSCLLTSQAPISVYWLIPSSFGEFGLSGVVAIGLLQFPFCS